MAVYTKLSRAHILDFLDDYDLGTLESFKGIEQGIENTNYHVYTDKGNYILTLFEGRISHENIPFVFAFTDFLRSKGIECPVTIPNQKNETLGILEDKPAALISFLDGKGIEIEDIDASACAQVGKLSAHMHELAKDFTKTRPNEVHLDEWKRLFALVQDQADTEQPGLKRFIEEELAYLESGFGAHKDLPRGVVHADIFPDNVFFQEGDLSGIIDFYFACEDYYVYDLALTINAWCFDTDHNFKPNFYKAMIKAYEDVRPLSDAEQKSLQFMGRAAGMRILITRLYDIVNHNPDNLVLPKQPSEYVEKIRAHQNGQIAY